MKIEKIKWIDQSALEATVTITDETFTCEAFCCPCKLNVGSELVEPLKSLSETSIIKSTDKQCGFKKNNNFFSYEISGKLIDIKKRIIQVGGIKIELCSLPGDLVIGDFIICYSSRLDV